MKAEIAIFGSLLLLIGFLLVLLFLDARAFARECIEAGGYVVQSGEVCMR